MPFVSVLVSLLHMVINLIVMLWRGCWSCDSITVSSTWELTSVYMRYSQGDGVDTSLSRLLYPRVSLLLVSLVCYIVLPAARSCAAWDDNNKDNVCKPSIPAGLKCPLLSKTISHITWFGTILNTLSEWIPRRPTGRSSVFEPGTLWDSVYFYIGWRIRRSKAE